MELNTNVCQCGCGTVIEPKPWHRSYGTPRFVVGHHARTRGASQPGRKPYVPTAEETPSGICECGCGNPTGIVNNTVRSKRYFKGYPAPRLPGHGTQGRGADHHNWKGGTVRTMHGYIMEQSIGHPHGDKNGYVRQHRLVMERILGRVLDRSEHVHHINGDKADNRPENLVVMTSTEHAQHHGPLRNHTSPETRAKMSAAGKKGAAARWGKN